MKAIFKTILGVGDKVTEIGASLHIPVIAQIDALKDQVKAAVSSRQIKASTAAEIIGQLETVRAEGLAAIEAAKALPIGQKGLIESKRFIAGITGIVAVVAIYFGLPESVADEVGKLVAGLAAAYILGDSMRPSVK